MRFIPLAAAALVSCTATFAADSPPPIDATAPPAAAPGTQAPPAPPPPVPPANDPRIPKASEVIRFVPSGEEATIALSAVANPDCSSAGKTVGRIVVAPTHGEVSFLYKKVFTAFSARIYEHCNEVEVPGMETHYKSAPGYFGEDSAEILFIYPNGNAQTVHFLVEVK